MEKPATYSSSTNALFDPLHLDIRLFRYAIALTIVFMIFMTGIHLSSICLNLLKINFKEQADSELIQNGILISLTIGCILFVLAGFILHIIILVCVVFNKSHHFNWIGNSCFAVAIFQFSYPFINFIASLPTSPIIQPFLSSFYDFFSFDVLAILAPIYCGNLLKAYISLPKSTIK